MKRLLFLIFLGFFAGFIYFFSLSLSKPKLLDITLQEGKMLPSIQELVDLNGDIIDERSLSNGKVLLNVWASWCITCLVDYKGNYALKLGVTGAPETFLVIDGKIVKHRIGEINQKVWNDEFKVFF